jgi:DNA-binding transcriptional LysR family regulator
MWLSYEPSSSKNSAELTSLLYAPCMTTINNLQQLREFVQIAESGSITAAAKALGLAQPTLSRHLMALENDLGSPLLQRDTHTMSLTEAGRVLLQDARELLSMAERMGRRLTVNRQTLRGHLRIVSVVDVGQWIVSRVLSRFQMLHPGITSELHLINRPTKFVKEGFDCGITIGSASDRRLVSRKVADLRRRLVASPSLVRRAATLSEPTALTSLPWLGILQPHFYARDRIDFTRGRKLVRMKFSPVMLLDTVTALREAAIAGAGFTALPEWMAARDIEAGRLVQLLPEWSLEIVDLHIVHGDPNHLPQRVTSLIDYLAAELPLEAYRLDMGDR